MNNNNEYTPCAKELIGLLNDESKAFCYLIFLTLQQVRMILIFILH